MGMHTHPDQKGRPPKYTSLGGDLGQTPTPKHTTPDSLGAVLGQDKNPKHPTPWKLGTVIGQK